MKYLGFDIAKEKYNLGNGRKYNFYIAKDLYSDEGNEVEFHSSQLNLIKYKIENYWFVEINKDKIVPNNILKSLQKKGVI